MTVQLDLPGFASGDHSSPDPYGIRGLVPLLREAGLSNSGIQELFAVVFLCHWATLSGAGGDPAAGKPRSFLQILAAHLSPKNVRGLREDQLPKTLNDLAHSFAASARAPNAPYAECLRAVADVLFVIGNASQAACTQVARWLADKLIGEGGAKGGYLLECFDEVDRATEERSAVSSPRWLTTLLQNLTESPSVEPEPDPTESSEHVMAFIAQRAVSDLLDAGSDPRAVCNLALNAHEFLLGLTRFVLRKQALDVLGRADAALSNTKSSKSSELLGDPNSPPFNIVLTNPPFGAAVSREQRRRSDDRTSMRDPERFFIARILEKLAPGGCASVIVPAGFLYRNGSVRHLRRELVENGNLEAVISLPRPLFPGAPGVNAAILILRGKSKESADAASTPTVDGTASSRTQSVLLVDGSDILGPTKRGALAREPGDSTEAVLQVVRRHIASLAPDGPSNSQETHKTSGKALPCRSWVVESKELAASQWDLSVTTRERANLDWLGTPLGRALRAKGQVVSLGSCSDLWVGLYIKETDLSDHRDRGDLGYFRIGDLHDGLAKACSLWVLPKRAQLIDRRRVLQPGDVLLSRSGTVDKAAVVCEQSPRAIAGGAIFVIRVDARRLQPEFLVGYLQCRASREWLKANSVRTLQPNLTLALMNRMMVPVPPLEVQLEVTARLRAVRGDLLTGLAEVLKITDPEADRSDTRAS